MQNDCLHILDHINCKFVVIEEIDMMVGEVEEYDEQGIEGLSSRHSNREIDSLYITVNTLNNYGKFYQR